MLKSDNSVMLPRRVTHVTFYSKKKNSDTVTLCHTTTRKKSELDTVVTFG